MKHLPLLLFLCIITCAWQCTNQQQEIKPGEYSRLRLAPLDSIGEWISQPDNYLSPEFHEIFLQHFQGQLQLGNIDSAGHLLSLAGKAACMNYAFDSLLTHTSIDFLQQYDPQLPDFIRTGIYCNLGDLYASAEDFETSNAYFSKSLKVIPADYETELQVAAAKSGLMYNFQNTGKLDSALLLGYEALESFERLENASGKMAVYATLSGVYKYMSDYREAEKLGDLATTVALESKDSISIYIAYSDKISLYNEIGHPGVLPWIDSMQQFYQAWMPKNPSYKFGAMSLYALKLVRENKLAEAQKILQELSPLFDQIEDPYFSDDYLYALAEYDLKANKTVNNAALFKAQLPQLQDNQDYNRLILFNSLLSKDALLRHDYKSAYFFDHASVVARDTLRQEQLRATVKELDKKYQTEKKAQQIALQSAQLERQKVLIGLLFASIVALLLLALAGYLIIQQKRSRKENAIQMQFTKQLLENTEEERSRIANDLHDSISHELLTLKQNIRKAGSGPEVGHKIDDIINDIRLISRNLHPIMLDKIGLQLSLETLCEQFMQHEKMYVSHDINYQKSLPKSAELQLFRIAQEGLSNALKYSSAEAVKVHLNQVGTVLQLNIQDNGQGFEVQKALNSGQAFGLHSILQRANAIGGKAEIYSNKNGTSIKISIA